MPTLYTHYTFIFLGESRNAPSVNSERNTVFYEEIDRMAIPIFSSSENPTYGNLQNTTSDYYINEGLGGLVEARMTQCEDYESVPINDNTSVANSDYYRNEELGGPTEDSRKDTEQLTETN